MLKIFIKTFGCQMNDRDSEALTGIFLDKGYTITEDAKEANVILVNTCSVREHAEDRAISLLGAFKKLEKRVVIGLIGCMAQNRGEEILKRMPHVNLACGPSALDKIPQYVEMIQNDGVRILDLEDRARTETVYQSSFRVVPGEGQVVISTGCSNYCSYCVVPYVRGNILHRRPSDIVDEVKRNVKLGVTNITLLGQNVNDYNYESVNFVDLLRMVDCVDGVEKITFISSNPKNTSADLFKVMAASKKIKKHIHLPFQSGSNRILELMRRQYTKEDYLNLADQFYKIVGGTLSTDIIVGFPTETEKDFLETKDLMEKVKFKYSYIFKYSPRPRTKAAQMRDDVDVEEKNRRHQILLATQRKISSEYKK